MRLSEFDKDGATRSAVDRLPADVLDQLTEARRIGSHGPTAMVRWLHHNPDFGDDYKHITVSMLDKWFVRRSGRAGSE